MANSCNDSATVFALPSCGQNVDAAGNELPGTCSGTGGGGFPGTVPVFNTNAVAGADVNDAAHVIIRYNAAQTPKQSATSTTYNNPCITSGVPTASDLRGDTTPAWNVVGTATGMGCCVPHGAAVNAVAPNNRITRLTPFTTASAVGARDAKNITAGIPLDLMGMSKAWGIATMQQLNSKLALPAAKIPPMFLHGGTHEGNVGLWTGNFTVKYNGDSWTQDAVLWCRHTGDAYDAALDPCGATAPAPDGMAINHQHPDKESSCVTCYADVITGAEPSQPQPAGSPTPAPCKTVYWQTCSDVSVTTPVDLGSATKTALQLYQALAAATASTPPDALGRATSAPQNAKSRCGGCFVTKDQYGPGEFAVLANLPPVALQKGADDTLKLNTGLFVDAAGQYGASRGVTAANGAPAGRGYVFALWTFNYTEAYAPNEANIANWPFSMVNAAGTGDDAQKWDTELANTSTTVEVVRAADGSLTNTPNKSLAACTEGTPCVAACAPPVPGAQPPTCNDIAWADAGLNAIMLPDMDDAYFTIHNHEIDIEVPSNSAQLYGPNGKQPGLNTINYNTWLTDIGEYDPGTKSLYQQVQNTMGTGFYAAVGPEEDDETYHEYKFVWVVDPLEGTAGADPTATCVGAKTYVAFYFDGVEQWRSHRFVPRRSGRVVFGLWPGWWGTNYRPMAYNQVYAKIARVDFVPQAVPSLVTNAPQMYDQRLPDGSEITCGIADISKRTPVPYAPVVPAPAAAPSSHGHRVDVPWWAWLLIGFAGAFVVVAVVVFVLRKRHLLRLQLGRE